MNELNPTPLKSMARTQAETMLMREGCRGFPQLFKLLKVDVFPSRIRCHLSQVIF